MVLRLLEACGHAACMLRLITGPKSPYMYSSRFEIRIPSGPETLQVTETLISLADVFSVIRTACLLGGSASGL